MTKKTPKSRTKKWFKEADQSILIIPMNIRGWFALLVFLLLLFIVAYINFGDAQTPLRSSLSFILDLVLICGLVGWLFDKKSQKK